MVQGETNASAGTNSSLSLQGEGGGEGKAPLRSLTITSH